MSVKRRQSAESPAVSAGDLVGCRHRLVQKLSHPEVPPTHFGVARAERFADARLAVWAKLPAGDKNFRRVDLELDPARPFYREMATLELMAAGVDLITNARFAFPQDNPFTGLDEDATQRAVGWEIEVDALLRLETGAYAPVVVSNHRVARKLPPEQMPGQMVHSANKTGKAAGAPGVPTHRLGLSAPLILPYKLRHHTADGYRLALAARALQESGLDSGVGFIIGQDRDTAFQVDTGHYEPALAAVLAQPLPTAPRRVKECAHCRFWQLCGPQLEAADDISLFLPGDLSRDLRARGIETVQGLIDARLGEPSALAQAWRDGVTLLRKPTFTPPPRADVEVDVDMEAYLDQGAYLWGVLHEGQYQGFVTWQHLGGAAEAENFQNFWTWLMSIRESTHAQGKTFAAYCYSAHGENHWMTTSATRFGSPPLAEVQEFLSSPEWVDVFSYVKRSFAGPHGLGLKVVAPLAGHAWVEEDFDGEESVNARRIAVRGDEQARRRLLDYNAGDVQATAAIREWMSAGAPGIADLQL